MKKKVKILFAEDEPSLGQIVKESLESRDFHVIYAKNGQEALELYHRDTPNILVLDVMMPQKDGFSLAQEIRKENKYVPIVFLTAKSQTKDVIEGFSVGGNDYLKKPFSIEELIVRINALLNRQVMRLDTENITLGKYTFNATKQHLTFNGDLIPLTHRESSLLYHLCQKRNEILDRSYILNKLWKNDDYFSARSMDVFISKLRKKLCHDKSIEILNVRGYGYKLTC
ncbi:response regulator transcription factor [Tenacibaculum sp. SG-28]|uniref:response regulator transcription factor n=1 Tax=Tenacibaculum sp. SG-28 TaxID=754426 RepID=UPI000CF5293C|nr:response regulator transcription factor [Tenacibaculum sp. SG-28]PQJ22812.1 DNA-binding response regulator [Tenacibaculum sp. SG-28]